jgi:hypothetical protein
LASHPQVGLLWNTKKAIRRPYALPQERFHYRGEDAFFACGSRSVTGSPMESDAERRVSDPVHLEHAVNERGLKVPTHNVTLYV